MIATLVSLALLAFGGDMTAQQYLSFSVTRHADGAHSKHKWIN